MESTRHPSVTLVRKYCNNFPSMPSRAMARLLVRDHPKLFGNFNSAYVCVRRARGAMGTMHRKRTTHKELFRPIHSQYTVPEGISKALEPFHVPVPAKILVLPDIHCPYHSKAALKVAIDAGVKAKCDTVYLSGDQLDFYQLSDFVRNPEYRNAAQEVETLKKILTILEKRFRNRYYKIGNHDARWQTYLFTHAPQFAMFAEFKLEKVLGLEERGWEVIQSKQLATFGKLNVLHGHEVTKGLAKPVNPARGIWLKVSGTCIVGHWHSSSQHTEALPIEKKMVTSWSMGCLSDLNPEYAPLNKWNHGFAIVDVEKDGEFHVQNFSITKGKAYPV